MPNVITGFDWKTAAQNGRDALTPEELSIVELLAQGMGTYQIARNLKTNRSAVWFKAKRIRLKLETGGNSE